MKRRAVIDALAACSLIAALTLATACSGGGSRTTYTYTVGGHAQKGPFITGTNVTIQVLDGELVPTGRSFSTTVTDDAGAFSIPITLGRRFLEVIADGYYFDEVNAQLSTAQLSLRAVADLAGGADINVNILTHLARDRILQLVAEGTGPAAATDRAREEVLAVFGITAPDALDFDRMNISETGESNAILLAVSAVLQRLAADRADSPATIVAELSQALSQLSSDLAEDGVLDDAQLADDLLQASAAIDPAAIAQNLEDRYTELGTNVDIPSFEDFLDSDADGTLNGDDPDDDNDGMLDGEDTYPLDSAVQWQYALDEPIASSVALDSDGTVHFGSEDGSVYAVLQDRTLKWSFPTGGHVHSCPAIGTDGTVYAGSEDGWLYAINPDGTEKWRFQTGYHITCSPALALDGTVYAGSQDRSLYAVNPDGTEKWSYATGGDVCAPAIGPDGTVYAGSHDNCLYAIRADGTFRWRYQAEDCVRGSPAIGSDGRIYFGSLDGYLYALNTNGILAWRYGPGPDGDIVSSPSIGADGTVYAGWYETPDDVYGVFAVDAAGTLLWSFETDDCVEGTAAIAADGTVHVASQDGILHVLNPDGTLKSWYRCDGTLTYSPTIGDDGTVYVGSSAGTLYALAGDSPLDADAPWPMFGRDERHTADASTFSTLVAAGLAAAHDEFVTAFEAAELAGRPGAGAAAEEQAAYLSETYTELVVGIRDLLTNEADYAQKLAQIAHRAGDIDEITDAISDARAYDIIYIDILLEGIMVPWPTGDDAVDDEVTTDYGEATVDLLSSYSDLRNAMESAFENLQDLLSP